MYVSYEQHALKYKTQTQLKQNNYILNMYVLTTYGGCF